MCEEAIHLSVLRPLLFDDIKENHWPVCSQFPVPCPYACGEKPQRQGLVLHAEQKCLLTPVQCEFRYAGCEVELTRRDMANHLRYSIVDHMTLMSLKHTESMNGLKEENKLLKQQGVDLREENERLQSQLTSRMKKLEIQLKCQAGAPRLQSQLTSRMKKLEIQLKCQAGAPRLQSQLTSRMKKFN